MEFKIGEQSDDGKTIENITRSIGGLSDITSAGPAILGPNCPTFVVTMVRDKKVVQLAIPEKVVDAILFREVKRVKSKSLKLTMSKEG